MSLCIDLGEGLHPCPGEAVTLDGVASVRAALVALSTRWPALSARLLDDGGNVRRGVVIYADDADIRFRDNLETSLATASRLTIAPRPTGWR